jgi:hypothetical protein
MSKKNYCTKCGLPIEWGITTFDQEGVCNYCRYYERVRAKLTDFDRWEELFRSHIDAHKGKYKYDAIVGFSGGKDSSYIIHILQKKYGCKVLAVTVDFGFMPSGPAIANMKRVVQSLNVDHIIYPIPQNDILNAFSSSLRKGEMVCELCSFICGMVPRKFAMEQHVPIYIMGSDRGQLLRGLSPETAPISGVGIIRQTLTPYTEEKSRRFDSPGNVDRTRNWLSGYGLTKEVVEDIFPEPKFLPGTQAYPMNLPFFLFHPYDEVKVKQTLVNEAGWELPQGDHLHAHHDCLLHESAMYFFKEAVGTTLTAGEICVDVREGSITRDDAIQVIVNEQDRLDQLIRPYQAFEETFSVSEPEVRKAVNKFRRRFNAYRKFRRIQIKIKKPRMKILDDL